jgi:hypothetical protein
VAEIKRLIHQFVTLLIKASTCRIISNCLFKPRYIFLLYPIFLYSILRFYKLLDYAYVSVISLRSLIRFFFSCYLSIMCVSFATSFLITTMLRVLESTRGRLAPMEGVQLFSFVSHLTLPIV